MTILDICDNSDVLSALRIVNIVITIIRIAVPILLIVSVMIDYLKVVRDNHADALRKANKLTITKTIAAILVFFIPYFVNAIADLADPNGKSYLSCLEMATSENINASYISAAEKDIDVARESLTKSDYIKALSSVNKIKDVDAKNELLDELNDIYEYIQIRETIYKISKDFDRAEYVDVSSRIEKIKDEDIKQKLKQELVVALGGKGSLLIYIQDPYDSLYRNLKNFSGTTLSAVLERNGSSVDQLNNQIEQAVKDIGVGTREAPVAAAFTLIETLAHYGYRINYDWAGKYYNLGVNGNWGSRFTPEECDSYSNPDYCKTKLIWKGLDCSGFVHWALIQGFQDSSLGSKYPSVGQDIPLSGKTEAICGVGDLLASNKHVVLIAGIDEEHKRYLVAESSSGGVKLSYYSFSAAGFSCRKIKYSN